MTNRTKLFESGNCISMQNLNFKRRPAPAEDESLRIPLDLAKWIEPPLLKKWVEEAVETLDWANPELKKYLDKHPDFQPRALLCLLIYAYATAILESEEIVAAIPGNSELRKLWRGPAPTTKELGRFRKENRALIKWGIVELLKRALQEKLQLGYLRLPSGLRQALVESAAERLDFARHMDRAAQGA